MVLGITGNIGAGKSFVCDVFQHLGIPVYNSDQRAKALMESDGSLVTSITTLLGSQAYKDGHADRAFIASKVFNDPELLQALNNLVHPAVGKDFDKWKALHANAPYCIKEAAILIESGAYKQVDKIALVVAPEELRVKRVMKRDQSERSEVQKRINNQMSQEDKLPYADFVITNDGERMLLPQILQIHQELTS